MTKQVAFEKTMETVVEGKKVKTILKRPLQSASVSKAVSTNSDETIDQLIASAKVGVQRLLKLLHEKILEGECDREISQVLKDIMNMLYDLKEREDAILESMDDETLEKVAKGE